MLSLIFLKLLSRIKQQINLFFYIVLFGLLLINNCSNVNKNILQPSRFKLIGNNASVIDFTINIKNYSILERNLKMFSTASIKMNLSFFSIGKQLLGTKKIERKIIYDRWNQDFSIKSSYNNRIIKYKYFNDLIKSVFVFDDVKIKFNIPKFKDNVFILYYDFILKSTDLAPPFNLVEYDLRFGNIKKTKQKILLKVTDFEGYKSK